MKLVERTTRLAIANTSVLGSGSSTCQNFWPLPERITSSIDLLMRIRCIEIELANMTHIGSNDLETRPSALMELAIANSEKSDRYTVIRSKHQSDFLV